jgi:hypothetical protein
MGQLLSPMWGVAVLVFQRCCLLAPYSPQSFSIPFPRRLPIYDQKAAIGRCLVFFLIDHQRGFAMIRRRCLLPLALAAALLMSRPAPGEDHKTLPWPSRTIQLKGESSEARPPVVTALSLHEGGFLATAGDDHYVRVWDLAKGNFVARLIGHDDWVRTVAYSPKGDILATAGNDKRILFWSATTHEREKVFVEHPEAIAMLAFDASGDYLAAVGFEDKVRVYDVAAGKLLGELTGPCKDMRAVAFSPDGKLLAAGGRNGCVRVWNLETGAVALEDELHNQRIRSIEFSPDGGLLASCGEDRRIVIRPLGSNTSRPPGGRSACCPAASRCSSSRRRAWARLSSNSRFLRRLLSARSAASCRMRCTSPSIISSVCSLNCRC